MQSKNLTDEQLFRAIARNTNAMGALVRQQLELSAVNTISEALRQAKLRESNAERIGQLARNYQEYTAELRRRYSLEPEEIHRLDHSWKRCGNGNGRIDRIIATTPQRAASKLRLSVRLPPLITLR